MANIKYTKEKGDDILRLIERGVPPSVAAQSCGVDRRLLTKWLQKGTEERAIRERAAKDPMSALAGDGIDLYDGMNEQERQLREYRDAIYLFTLAFSKAEAQAEADLVQHIVETGKGGMLVESKLTAKGDKIEKFTAPDAKPAQWILSRRWRERWGDKMALDVTNDDAKPKRMDLSRLSAEELVVFKQFLETVTVEEGAEDDPES